MISHITDDNRWQYNWLQMISNKPMKINDNRWQFNRL